MAGMDWFRWHHGSVTDPKFQLVAKKARATLGDVIVVWAFILENASAADDRGTVGPLDFETLDFLLGAEEGTATRILDAMAGRGLIEGSRIASWDKRQPKREREGDNSAERTRAYRERQRELGDAGDGHVTPSDATEHQKKPREEKSREEEKKDNLPGFALFWAAWPSSDRKQAKGKCLDAWKKAKAEADAALVVAHVERMRAGPWQRDGGKYIPAPLTYLNQRRWEGVDDAANDDDPYGLRTAL